MVGLHGLGHLESAAAASYMESDELPSSDPDSAIHDDAEDLAMDVVPESDPEDDETLRGLVADMHAEALQASSVDE